MKYVFIKQKRLEYPVPTMCRLLEVSASGYYKWLNKPESERKKQEIRFQTEIKAAHRRNRETFGPERLQKDLESNGVIIGVHRIKRIRRELRVLEIIIIPLKGELPCSTNKAPWNEVDEFQEQLSPCPKV